jgi:hypothetical protein
MCLSTDVIRIRNAFFVASAGCVDLEMRHATDTGAEQRRSTYDIRRRTIYVPIFDFDTNPELDRELRLKVVRYI